MNSLDLTLLVSIYKSNDLTVDEKIENTIKNFPQLSPLYKDDLRLLFTKSLPIIKGLEISTKFGDSVRNYMEIISMPDTISSDIQKALMRIGGCLGGFEIEKWGRKYEKTDAMIKRLQEYKEQYIQEHHYAIGYVSVKDDNYPKVFQVTCDEVAGMVNESFVIKELVGIVLS